MRIILAIFNERFEVYWSLKPFFEQYPQYAELKDKIYYSYTAINGIALREANLDLLDDLERNSVDFYATMRSAYLQNRQTMSCYSKKQTGAVSYDFDFNDEVYDEMEAQ